MNTKGRSVLSPSELTRPASLDDLTPEQQMVEMVRCSMSCSYFINEYGMVYHPESLAWIPFHLWPMQEEVLQAVLEYAQVIGLKSRQVGLTWLILHVALWLMLFKPIAEILLFSKREDEAIYLLGEERLRGIYNRLPPWMQADRLTTDDKKHMRLSNGSGARAFPSNAGDSYTATLAFIDEADLLTGSDLRSLLGRVKPTIDAGGQLVMISRPDKGKPASEFKRIYREATQGKNTYFPLFIPWYAHPERDAAWYAKQQADFREDDLHEQYPATDAEALSARTDDKLFDTRWIEQCFEERAPLNLKTIKAPAIGKLQVYQQPNPEYTYTLGVDPAEGNDNSDDSSITAICDQTGEEVAHLSGRIHYTPLARMVDQIGTYFNRAKVLIERNNHGAAVIQWMQEHSRLKLIFGPDKKPGWWTSGPSKNLLYSDAGEHLKQGAVIIHSRKTRDQLISIELATLEAPESMHDDAAMSYVLALAGRRRQKRIRNEVV